MRCLSIVGVVCTFALISSLTESGANAQQASATPARVLERTSSDWNHSGSPTTFTLYGAKSIVEPAGANRLVIKPKVGQRRIFRNLDDVWSPITSHSLLQQNLVPSSKHMLFISAGRAPDAQIYLILVGAGSGCCVGSLDVLTAGPDGTPRFVFHSKEHLLEAVVPLTDGSGIQLIGQPSDSEARALKNAQSYDPYRVYLVKGLEIAKYDPELSKAYTEAHYCQWHGPVYDERFVAVGRTTGARTCRTMSEAKFQQYRLQHPEQFPEP